MTKISQLSSIGDSLAIGDQFLIRDIDDTGSPNKSVTISGMTRALDTGTALAPALAFASDKNTGIYSPGADTLALSTGGTERLRIDSSGNVGIGTTSPLTKLDVRSGVITAGTLESTNGAEVLRGYYSGSGALMVLGTEYSSGGPLLGSCVKPSTSAQEAFLSSTGIASATRGAYVISGNQHKWYIGAAQTVAENSSVTMSEAMRLNSGGLLGLGISDPVEKLVVGGATANIGLYNTTAGSTASPSFSRINFYGYLQTSIWNVASISCGNSASNHYGGILQFATNTTGGTHTTALTIDSSQRVGIGTASPGANLHVNNISALSSVPAIGSPGGLFNATVGASGYGLISGALNTGAYFFQAQTTDGTSATYPISLNPNGGNVGIGTTAPLGGLEITGTSLPLLLQSTSANTNYITHRYHISGTDLGYIGAGGGAATTAGTASDYAIRANLGALIFATNGNNERARIDSSGRLLVGTSTARSIGTQSWGIQQEGTTFTNTGVSTVRNSADAFGSYFVFGKSRGTAVGANTIVANGDELGRILFSGADGTDVDSLASWISCEVDGTPGANDMPGRLVFSTTADGAASPTERMRINSAGNILTNTTSPYSVSLCTTDFDSASQFGLTLRDTGSAIDANMMYFYKSGNVRGNITTTATATSFNTSSDYRLKQDIVPIENASSRVQQLRPVNFAWAETGSRCDGFLAHEAQAVVPQSVTGEKDAVDADGKPVYQGIDQSKLVPLLTAALQEAIAEIASLKDRVAALEGE